MLKVEVVLKTVIQIDVVMAVELVLQAEVE